MVHKFMLNYKIKGFDAIMVSMVPTYYRHHEDSEGDCPENLPKRTFRGTIVMLIHLFNIPLYLVVSWMLRKSLFFFNIDKEKVNEDILKGVALDESFFTPTWLVFISVYCGCAIFSYFVNILYYKIGHPWSMAREKNC